MTFESWQGWCVYVHDQYSLSSHLSCHLTASSGIIIKLDLHSQRHRNMTSPLFILFETREDEEYSRIIFSPSSCRCLHHLLCPSFFLCCNIFMLLYDVCTQQSCMVMVRKRDRSSIIMLLFMIVMTSTDEGQQEMTFLLLVWNETKTRNSSILGVVFRNK
jgi:hypothetical protein